MTNARNCVHTSNRNRSWLCVPFEVVIRHENARALHLIQLQNTLLFDNGGKRQHFEDQGSNVIYGKEYETHTHTRIELVQVYQLSSLSQFWKQPEDKSQLISLFMCVWVCSIRYSHQDKLKFGAFFRLPWAQNQINPFEMHNAIFCYVSLSLSVFRLSLYGATADSEPNGFTCAISFIALMRFLCFQRDLAQCATPFLETRLACTHEAQPNASIRSDPCTLSTFYVCFVCSIHIWMILMRATFFSFA